MTIVEPAALRARHEAVLDVAALAGECRDQDVDERRLLLAAKHLTAKLAAGCALWPSERTALDDALTRLLTLDGIENRRHGAIWQIAVAFSRVFEGCRRRLRRLRLERAA